MFTDRRVTEGSIEHYALRGEARQKNCRSSSSDAQYMKDALHGEPAGVVVGVDGFGVEPAAGWVEGPGGGEERFDSFVAENDQRGDRAEPAGERCVAAGVADATNDVLAAELSCRSAA
jgi:hypothetical protein